MSSSEKGEMMEDAKEFLKSMSGLKQEGIKEVILEEVKVIVDAEDPGKELLSRCGACEVKLRKGVEEVKGKIKKETEDRVKGLKELKQKIEEKKGKLPANYKERIEKCKPAIEEGIKELDGLLGDEGVLQELEDSFEFVELLIGDPEGLLDLKSTNAKEAVKGLNEFFDNKFLK
jgi:hypothetical protein